MQAEEILRYALSFLGGGMAVAVGNWIHAGSVARREKTVAHIGAQLKELYGPLYYFTNQNARLFDLCHKFDEAYTAEISSKNWSPDTRTQASVNEEASATIAISNEYIRCVEKNNDSVANLLEREWHLIDSDDIEDFSAFLVHHVRLKTEYGGSLKTPFMVYKHVGAISYMPPAMLERVESKFRAKTLKLQEFRA
jgi:hypothetical protein